MRQPPGDETFAGQQIPNSAGLMTKEQPVYLSYLLRLWRVNRGSNIEPATQEAIWRATVESPHTREQKRFASLDELFDFLRVQTGYLNDYPGREEGFDVIRTPP